MASDDVRQHRLQRALAHATQALLAAREPEGHWVGELASSALSTATAVTALAVFQKFRAPAPAGGESAGKRHSLAIAAGLAWLAAHQNADGGWGDTTRSLSNLSTTTLGWAAFGAGPEADAGQPETVARAVRWLARHAGGIDPDQLAPAIIRSYGKDRTFSVPILTMCALAGRLGVGDRAWRHVMPLPFELAACPPRLFAALRLPVVSYALPALIAIGQVRHHCCPSRNPLVRLLRKLTRARTLRVLDALQPANGGFLEAAPLTSFVTMSLAAAGQAAHGVTQRAVDFLLKSQRADGSWPIDTNLATWLTTLAVNALPMPRPPNPGASRPPTDEEKKRLKSQMRNRNRQDDDALSAPTFEPPEDGGHGISRAALKRWLLAQQYRHEHPYTHAAPGGWAWTDRPGGVPDADDTAGALLALHKLEAGDAEVRAAAAAGIAWLLQLQNADGGIPTFCRGWGHLPFDRSSADLTAHAIRAWLVWRETLPSALHRRSVQGLHRAVAFLIHTQRADGSWVPLWFGNQHGTTEENPTYGTSRVLLALAAVADDRRFAKPATDLAHVHQAGVRGLQWLVRAQNADGSWGGFTHGPSSVEETALAVEALAKASRSRGRADAVAGERAREAWRRGAGWLVAQVESGGWRTASPIGFYFARLWYFETLYPLIFSVAALAAADGDQS